MFTIIVESDKGIRPQGLADVIPQYLAHCPPPGVDSPDHLVGDETTGHHVILAPRARRPGVALPLHLSPQQVAP